MNSLKSYINIHKSKSVIEADDKNIYDVVYQEILRLGFEADLNHIDVSKVTRMSWVFAPNKMFMKKSKTAKQAFENFNGDISEWDVSNVIDMGNMFNGCTKFNGDLSRWDVSKVKNMTQMFYGCFKFNGDLSRWNVSNVETMHGMFQSCRSFEGIGLSSWDMKKVKDKRYMLDGCIKIKDREKTNDDPTTWEVGDIICGTAGATMSLPRFFKIIKKTNLKFTCIRLKGKLVSGSHNGQWQEVASEEQYDNREYTGVANKFGSLKIDDTYMSLWNGKPLYGDDQD